MPKDHLAAKKNKISDKEGYGPFYKPNRKDISARLDGIERRIEKLEKLVKRRNKA